MSTKNCIKYFGFKPKRELHKYVNDIRQLADIELSELIDGRTQGVRKASFYTARGLKFDVLIDRALDISSLYYRGYPIAWRTCVRETHPTYYDPRGEEWLRTFFGGLLTTCGLTTFGAPTTDLGEELVLHGRISNLPAQKVSVDTGWNGEDYELTIKGEVHQVKAMKEHLVLKRKIQTTLVSKSLMIHDRVINQSTQPIPHMVLYHINLGFPLLTEESQFVIDPSEVQPLTESATTELVQYDSFIDPQKEYPECVYQFQIKPIKDDQTSVALINPNLYRGLGLAITFKQTQLPYLLEWKNMREGEYVLGLEPANCPYKTRSELRGQGKLPRLAPYESREYDLEIKMLDGKSDIQSYRDQFGADSY